ncbi:hypothetical protein RHMOL_Rhmol01G0294100 [Rhododendron molle]|uniref:Uncharacterized protein n=1 Tax=Rhododendron molle TaxID=49168 RepID=A0ACC0Q747_RHOML|nr:hypothetical protein RHMOL_Rhmol01G0294100 [Rhododendron molle]
MSGYGILDGTNNAVSSDLFMRNVDYFDFPMESLEGDDLNGGYWDAKLQSLAPILSEVLAGSPLPSGGYTGSATSVMAPSLSGPSQEPVLKCVPNSVEEAARAGISHQNNYSDGPVSVLGSLSSCSSEKRLPTSSELFSCSKRSWFSTIYTHRSAAPKELSLSSGFSESNPPKIRTNPVRKLKKKKKLARLSGATKLKQRSVGCKRCSHCEVRETPQWRDGPMGRKSLCNACGVRYSSGRLFSEYRPAASPTFVPSLHSNFHKGVIEMREKVQDFVPIPSQALVGSSLASGGNAAAVVGEESSEVKPKPKAVKAVSRSSSSPHNNYSIGVDSGVLQTPSPVSAHQSSSSSCSSEMPMSSTSRMVTRSMRSRLSATNPRRFEELSRSKGFSESNLTNTNKNPVKRKLKLPLKLPQKSGVAKTTKCSHCETRNTPQWRHGPMGKNTLCNACGVRYLQGRLVPEYRPADSPSFVPSLHSSSHKVIVEMRKRTIQEEAETEPPTSPLPESGASDQHYVATNPHRFEELSRLKGFSESNLTNKRGKRKSEDGLDAFELGTSKTPVAEMGAAEVEIEPVTQKKPFFLITPTFHTGFSFSIIHLLSAVRTAMITLLPEDSLDAGKHLDKNDGGEKVGEDQHGNQEATNGLHSQVSLEINKSENFVQLNVPSLTVQEIVNRVTSNPGDPFILETQEPLLDLVRGVLKIFSSKSAPLGAKGWKPLVFYEKSTKSWSWIGPASHSSSDNEVIEEVTSPESWGLPHKMLVKLVDAFANWLKSGQETLQQIGSLPCPPSSLMQFNLDEKQRFRDLRAQKSLTTISPSSDEVRGYFREEEVLRYSIPDRAFSYTTIDGRKSIVAPLRRCGGKPTSKARDHFLLKRDRPPHVTIRCLVRDAAARLPGSIGTRADVCTLLRDSQYIVEEVSDAQVYQVVSKALDRLHYERDPCVQFDGERKLWVYLHREREEEDFEDDGTSSTKKWKKPKKEATEPLEQGAVTVAYHGSGEQPGVELSSDLDAEPSCGDENKRMELTDYDGKHITEDYV